MTKIPRFSATLLFAVLLALPMLTSGQIPARDGRYYIEFRQFGPQATAAVRAAGGRTVHEFPEYGVLAAQLPAQAVRALANNPNVLSIEEDPQRQPLSHVTGELPYGIAMVQATQVSDAAAGNRTLCIIDSGYSISHPDLPSATVTGHNDPSTGDWFTDGCGHGTHVAGTVAALQNDAGVLGVLPSGTVKLHIEKVFGNDCSWAYSSDLIAALNSCRVGGAHIVSMSLGGSFRNRFEQRAFDNAYNAGVLSVAAAGNAGDTTTSYPAGYGSVISVAAIDQNKVLASFSQRNRDVELAAPGVSVLSTVPWNETNSLTVDAIGYEANWIENAARGTATGPLANGGLCDSVGDWAGQVVLCQRGSITFFSKVTNVQSSAGIAAVIYNNAPGNFSGTLGAGNSSAIPAISLSQADGQFLVTNKLGFNGTVVSTRTNDLGYTTFDGTSMATPHVSGVAALVWSHAPGKTNAQIRDALKKTAEDLGAAGRDTSYGFGLVRACEALKRLTGNPAVCP